MQKGWITCSLAKSLQPAVPAPPSMTDHNIWDSLPHKQAQGSNLAASSSTMPATMAQASNPQAPPAMDPALQAAMAAFFTTMTQQFQAQVANPQPVNLPNPLQYQPAPQSHIKTWDPDPYDGSDPTKLCSFPSQCKLVFQSQPEEYRHDHAKIMFAVSWLKGMAQWWFKPILALEDHKLPWYTCKWEHFEDALNSTFGEPDPFASATHKLDNLVMKDYHHLNKYNVDFNEYATITSFDKCVLYTCYYKGLAPWIKDGLVYSGCPPTLVRLWEQAQELDLHHWKHKDEENFMTTALKSSGSSNSKSFGTTPAMSSNTSKATSTSKNPSRSSTPSLSSAKSQKQDLSKILGPDRKLLPEEKEHCKKSNLCLICTFKEHFSNKCPSHKNYAMAHTANLDTTKDIEEQSEGSVSEAESLGN